MQLAIASLRADTSDDFIVVELEGEKSKKAECQKVIVFLRTKKNMDAKQWNVVCDINQINAHAC